MFRRTGVLACLTLAAVVSGSLPATASPLTTTPQTATIPLTETDWSPSNFTGTVDPMNFTKFNPALGTLESVNLSYSYTFQHNVSMNFSSPSTLTVGVASNGVAINRPDGSVIGTGTVPDYSISQTYTGPTFPSSLSLPPHVVSGKSSATLTSAADLALFTQTSPTDTMIKLPTTATARSTFTSSTGNGAGGAQVYASVDATISYTYGPKVSAVPEPSTFAALGLGLGGYIIARRNRRAAA